jgi:nicotinate-nucleotide adenylyltransferase
VGTGRRTGIFGGTFDPPHVGHVIAAVNVRHELRLDRVLMVPAAIPWQKVPARAVSDASDRVTMLHAAVDGVPGLEVSTVEIDRGGASYTADTLEALAAAAPDDERFLVVGSDVAPLLDTWNRPEVVRTLATIVVYDRERFRGGTPPTGWRWQHVEVPHVDVSSTDIRRRARDGAPIDGLVVPAVARYVEARGLYCTPAAVRS